MKFFFDNNLAPHLARAMHELVQVNGHSVVHLCDKFERSATDATWINALASERDWIVISADLGIVRSKVERPIWKKAGLIGFFLKKGWLAHGPLDQAWRLIRRWPDIVTFASRSAPGSTYRVPIQQHAKMEAG